MSKGEILYHFLVVKNEVKIPHFSLMSEISKLSLPGCVMKALANSGRVTLFELFASIRANHSIIGIVQINIFPMMTTASV